MIELFKIIKEVYDPTNTTRLKNAVQVLSFTSYLWYELLCCHYFFAHKLYVVEVLI